MTEEAKSRHSVLTRLLSLPTGQKPARRGLPGRLQSELLKPCDVCFVTGTDGEEAATVSVEPCSGRSRKV